MSKRYTRKLYTNSTKLHQRTRKDSKHNREDRRNYNTKRITRNKKG